MNSSSFFRFGMVTATALCLAIFSLAGCSDSDEVDVLNVGEEENANQGDNTDPNGNNDQSDSDVGTNANQGGDDVGGNMGGSDDTGANNTNGGDDIGANIGGGGDTGGDTAPDPDPTESENTETLFDETVPLSNGYTEVIEVDVPEDVYSIAISVTEGPPADHYLVTDWRGPNNFQLIPDGWEDQEAVCYQNCNNRVIASPGAFGALAPNNPDSQVEAGTHQFRVGTSDMMSGGFLFEPSTAQMGNDVRVTVHAEIVDGAVDRGTLDLNLFFTGANGWSASSAPSDTAVQAVIDGVDALYDQVNIDIGEVAYHDVDESFQVIEDLMSGTGDLAQLFAKSSEAELEGPSVFFVSELRMGGFGFQGGGGVLGISGGIPGPMIVDGSPRSGVAVATDSSQAQGAPGIVHVTGHELGHYLGLFHTSEQFAMPGTPAHDPLPDTAEDDPSLLMHATGGGDTMSEWQGRVMRKNPWVYFD